MEHSINALEIMTQFTAIAYLLLVTFVALVSIEAIPLFNSKQSRSVVVLEAHKAFEVEALNMTVIIDRMTYVNNYMTQRGYK